MKEMILACADVEILMGDYLEGCLVSTQREALERHLSGCPACSAEMVRLQRLEGEFEEQLAGCSPLEVPPGLQAAIIGRLPRTPAGSTWVKAGLRAGGLALAACAVLGLAVMAALVPARREADRSVEIVFYAPGARMVNLAGDFNDWDTAAHPMKRDVDGTWRLSLRLPPGLYQYNFYVDRNRWAENPGTTALISDGFGGRNALLLVEG